MSEKRLIDFEQMCKFCKYNIGESSDLSCRITYKQEELCPYWLELPKPVLADVCGTRTLDSMTEEEIKDLLEMLYEEFVTIEAYNIPETPMGTKCEFIYVQYKTKSNSKHIYIYMGATSRIDKEVLVVKWFIEHGFNIFGDEK